MQEAKFDESSVIWFTEKEKKPLDATRLQSGMFTDRPDLWIKPGRNHRKRVPKEQLGLLGEGENFEIK